MRDFLLPVDYINKNKNVILSPSNFNEADLILFSVLPLIDLSHIGFPKEGEDKKVTLKALVDKQIEIHHNEKYGLILNRELNRYLEAAAKSKRYQNLAFYNLFHKVDDKTQSGFFMVDISKTISVVVFAGTDDTVVGWVEDLNLLVNQEVECLKNAREYVNRNCTDETKTYIFAGHSKGGLICCYTLLTANDDVKDKILIAYDLDGPGFSKDFIHQYKHSPELMKLKIICPRGSIVGRLFYQFKKAHVIRSNAFSLMEHNPSTWEINEDDFSFVKCKSFSKRSTITDTMIKKYLNKLSKKDTEQLVDAMSKILNAGNAKTLTMLFTHPLRIFKAIFALPKAERKQVLLTPFKLIKTNTEAKIDLLKHKDDETINN